MKPFWQRNTCPFSALAKFGLGSYDYIFGKGKITRFSDSTICNKRYYAPCYGASDHYIIWTIFHIED